MDLYVDGIAMQPDRICFNDGMGFGQFRTAGASGTLPVYEMVFRRKEFIDLFSEAYDVICRDIRQDDEATGDTSDFSEIGYVPLAQALDHAPQFREIVYWYLARDHIFPRCLSPDIRRLIVNSIDDVLVGDEIRIRGRCRILASAVHESV